MPLIFFFFFFPLFCSYLQSMATLESALSIFASHRFSNNYRLTAKPPDSIKLHASTSLFSHPNNNLVFSSKASTRLCFMLCSALQEVAAATETTTITEEKTEQTQPPKNVKKKLYVVNLPWSLSVTDIKDLFAQCGTVTDVEVVLKLCSCSAFLSVTFCVIWRSGFL